MGQSQDDDNITASASVTSAVTVTGAENIQFGNIVPSTNARTVSGDGTVTGDNAGDDTGAQPGRFDVTKGPETPVTLTFSALTALTDDTETLTFSYGENSYLSTSDSEVLNGVVFDPASVLDISSESTYVTASTFSVFVGGTVTPTADQAEGTYTGSITLTVEYN
ncbi:MAG: DUF4402 domain-containing protein [Balneolales bacterium]